MGHGGEAMVRLVYGQLRQVRYRAGVLQYRVEQHAAKLGERLDRIWRLRQTDWQTKPQGQNRKSLRACSSGGLERAPAANEALGSES